MITKLTSDKYSLDEMFKFIRNTYKIDELSKVTYDDIVRVYGDPSILHCENDESDGKIQVEWVFEVNQKPFTIYDLKTYDVDFTMEKLKNWSIGSLSEDEEVVNQLKKRLKKPKSDSF